MPLQPRPWRVPVRVGTGLVFLLLIAAFALPRLTRPENPTLDTMLDGLTLVFGCLALAVLVGLVTAGWVWSLSRRAGVRFPWSGLLPLALVGSLIAAFFGMVIFEKGQAGPTEYQSPRPATAPVEPLEPPPE